MDFVRTELLLCVSATDTSSDHDPSRWTNDPNEINLRRKVFWEICSTDAQRVRIIYYENELFTYCQFQSIGCGRPPFFQQESISCQLPTDDAKLADLDDDSDGESSECGADPFNCYNRILI